MRLTEQTMQLPCVLTDTEKLEKAQIIAEAVGQCQRLEGELKTVSSEIKAKVAGYEATIALNAQHLSTGKETRSVECAISYDWKNKERIWVRKDTGEEVNRDIIPEIDLQEEAELEAKREEKAGKKKGKK